MLRARGMLCTGCCADSKRNAYCVQAAVLTARGMLTVFRAAVLTARGMPTVYRAAVLTARGMPTVYRLLW